MCEAMEIKSLKSYSLVVRMLIIDSLFAKTDYYQFLKATFLTTCSNLSATSGFFFISQNNIK